jgi:carboxyl-terminal processing protease
MNSFVKFQKFLVTILIIALGFYGGYYFGKRGFLFEIRKNPPEVKITNQYPSRENVDFSLFWEVWGMLDNMYLERPIDHQKMVYGAISGMVAALDDPYTTFLQPKINKAMTEALNGNYQGIGAELVLKDTQLTVVTPLDGSPAKAAGVKAGDKILAINGEVTHGLSVEEAVLKIRGDAGTKVTLKLQSGSEEAKDVEITRGIITVSSVKWEDKGDGVAYVRVSRFGGETDKDWNKAVDEINTQMKELDSIIVDVRGNPGGYLQAAIYLAGEFYRNDVVVYQEDPAGTQLPYTTNRVGAFNKVPGIFVLIDEGSASASEILAGALKEKRDAVLVGKKSFGKGTIQDAKDFKDGSGVHITIAKWLTPNKTWVHKVGIKPDVEVEITKEDIEKEHDSQLEKAIELAKKI